VREAVRLQKKIGCRQFYFVFIFILPRRRRRRVCPVFCFAEFCFALFLFWVILVFINNSSFKIKNYR
jgi:hypothetical protein